MAAYKGMAEEAAEILAQPIPRNEYAVMLMTLVVLTVADTVLCTVNLYYYTDTYAQFFNQVRGNLRRRALPRLSLRAAHRGRGAQRSAALPRHG